MSTSNETYTYIVVGAGAAGCVVANRLSSDPAHRVLLLEAGGRDRNPLIHIPVGFTKLTTPDVNWGFSTVPQPQMDGREMWYPQGRTLGGSTSINARVLSWSNGKVRISRMSLRVKPKLPAPMKAILVTITPR